MSKTSYSRAERVADQIKVEVADILMRKIKDPRVRFVTVTAVDVTTDLRVATVFVTTMETGQAEADLFAGLAHASGYVRSELGKRLTLRYLPEVVFAKDISGVRGDRILQLLDTLSGKQAQGEQASSSVAVESKRP
ncbi:MAG: 30S ribosome-binding factor RbfA [Nitrospira sp.]|nr:30S ribosome-binding factor RbfA [Nitrospira sp.]